MSHANHPMVKAKTTNTMAILLKGEHFKPYSSIAEVHTLSVEEYVRFFNGLDDVRAVLLFNACATESKADLDKYYDAIKSRVSQLTAPKRAGNYLGFLLRVSYSFMVNARGYEMLLSHLKSTAGITTKPEEELRHLEALVYWLKVQVVPEEHRLLVGQLIDAFIIQLEEMPFN